MLGHFVIQIFQMIPVFLFKNKFHQYVQAAVCSLVTKKMCFPAMYHPTSQPTSSASTILSLFNWSIFLGVF